MPHSVKGGQRCQRSSEWNRLHLLPRKSLWLQYSLACNQLVLLFRLNRACKMLRHVSALPWTAKRHSGWLMQRAMSLRGKMSSTLPSS
ncbi:Uncharacterised protein [Klebsiella pneumoniae]|uniref:Uncharacterized protein n=1 Tax=Klebsiella pneumoniae TaxID=573 RepID=A0A377XC77_KLEPN|nr:Uncharacterised protein [Klebsiella pneumoniae]